MTEPTTCALCGADLKHGGAQTELGVVGPDCEQLVGALRHRLLKQGGLEALATGPVTLPMQRVERTWTFTDDIKRFVTRAARAGLPITGRTEIIDGRAYRVFTLKPGAALTAIARGRA